MIFLEVELRRVLLELFEFLYSPVYPLFDLRVHVELLASSIL
jgi:hypothetical protein